MSEPLLVERTDGIARVTLNRPTALNAIDASLHTLLADVWGDLDSPDIRAVVLTGAGSAFSAGGDLDHIARLHADPELRRGDMRQAARIVRGVTGLAAPVIAAVNGPAVGLGASLVAMADLVVMAESAYVSDPHVVLGLTAADGGLSLWPLLVGLHRAKEYLLTGSRIDAPTALTIGLANRVVADTEVLSVAEQLARRIAGQPRLAVTTTKRGLNRHLEDALGAILDDALGDEGQCFDDPEHRAAFARLRRA